MLLKSKEDKRISRKYFLERLPYNMSVCSDCGEYKKLDCFQSCKSNSKGIERGVKIYCKDCMSKRHASSDRVANRERMREIHMKRSYGITRDDYKEMVISQNGVCAICGKAETAKRGGSILPLAVDHCHYTGEIRGLLCSSCNKALGYFYDNVDTLQKAIDYIESHKK